MAGPGREGLRLGVYGYILAQARRNMVRTGATIVAVAVAVAFLVIVASLSVGLRDPAEPVVLGARGEVTPVLPIADFAVAEEGAYVGLFAPRLLDPAEVSTVRRIAQESAASAQDIGVFPYTERVLWRRQLEGLDAQAVRLIGVDPALGIDAPYTSYHPYSSLALGGALPAGAGPELVLGYALWEGAYASAPIGSELTLAPRNTTWLTAPIEQLRSEGSVEYGRMWRLSGLELVGVLDRDSSTDWCAYVTLGHLANATGAGATADGPRCEAVSVAVRSEAVDIEVLATDLAAASSRITSWYVTAARDRALSDVAEGLRAAIYGWLVVAVGVILAAMVLGVSNTVLLGVSQRRREIGTLRALGLTRGEVVRLVTYEALFIVMMGWGIGFLSGHIVTSTLSTRTMEMDAVGVWLAPGRTVPWVVVASILAALAAALAGSALPARRAAALDPAEALAGP
jgi:cell division protein FtsX